MRKIPTLYVRDPHNMKHVTDQVTGGCEWVVAGEGVATRKYDGTCIMLDDHGHWWARREVKPGKTPPNGYNPISTDPNTGKTVGWEPVDQSPFAKFFGDALNHTPPLNGRPGPAYPPGTYELIGPKINGNPERKDVHTLARHEDADVIETDLDQDSIRKTLASLAEHGHEGIVFHHPDGRMAKIKVRDFA